MPRYNPSSYNNFSLQIHPVELSLFLDWGSALVYFQAYSHEGKGNNIANVSFEIFTILTRIEFYIRVVLLLAMLVSHL